MLVLGTLLWSVASIFWSLLGLHDPDAKCIRPMRRPVMERVVQEYLVVLVILLAILAQSLDAPHAPVLRKVTCWQEAPDLLNAIHDLVALPNIELQPQISYQSPVLGPQCHVGRDDVSRSIGSYVSHPQLDPPGL